jgi:16S rRNA (cytosine1402-N4)-methyltransferase
MSRHLPVMQDDVIDALAPRDGGVYVDGTFGGGGYSERLLQVAETTVYGIDRDPAAIARGALLAEKFAPRLKLVEGRFSEMEQLVGEKADGIALDLGVSSFQLDDAERGFSFREDGPLDMRMGGDGPSAADVVNTYPEAELADILWRYGEEKKSRAIARAIVAARPITRTLALAALVEEVAGPAARRLPIHPATRTFQALRIYVNDELGELQRGLEAAERTLKPSGRLAVVSFHSLEDRIVKQFLAERGGKTPRASRHLPDREDMNAPTFRLLAPSPRMPKEEEIARNPRARSARLRAAERTGAPAFPSSPEGGHA